MANLAEEQRWIHGACPKGHRYLLYGAPRSDGSSIRCTACARINRKKSPPVRVDPCEITQARLISGEPPPYAHPQDRYAAVKVLTSRGVSILETSRRVGVSTRQISVIRRKLREGIPYGTTSA